MKAFFFLMLFGLFEMGYAANLSPGTLFGVVKETCQRALGRTMGLVPANPLEELQLDLTNKFAQYGHTVGEMKNSLMIDDDVYHKGLTNLAVALRMGGEMPLTQYSKPITNIVIGDKGREVTIWDWGGVFPGRSLTVHVSAYTPVEEIVPKMNVALLEHEIGRKVRVHGPTSFQFAKSSDMDDEIFTSFLEKTFLKALEDGKGAAHIADFPDRLILKIVDKKTLGVDFRSAFYSGFEIFVSVDAPAESLFLRLANVLLEEQVTVWMWEHYAYRGRASGSAVINSGVDDAAYERGLKLLLEWFDDSSLVRDAEHILVRLGRIYVTENQLEIKPRQIPDDETVFDIYIPSNGAEMDAKTFTKLFLPPAE